MTRTAIWNVYHGFADLNLSARTRLSLVALLLLLLASFLFPLWTITLTAPQYPDGLTMQVYSYRLVGGHQGHDIAEINELNHYIGMRKIARQDLTDLDWMPFALGLLGLLTLRVAAIGNLRGLIDLAVLNWYFALFALARFAIQLYAFGHDLDPHAEIRMTPFMPVLLGRRQVANFITTSLPSLGSVLYGAFLLAITLMTLSSIRKARRSRDEVAKLAAGI